MKKNYFKPIVIFLFFCVSISACEGCKSRKKVDVSHIQVDIEIVRFEQKIFDYDKADPETYFATLQAEYPDFFELYIEQMLEMGKADDPEQRFLPMLIEFLNDPYMLEVLDEVNARFDDLSAIENELEQAFRHYQYYFPGNPVPEVYTFISAFNFAAITYDSTHVGFGVDMYLGKDFKYYPSLFPEFLFRRFEPGFIPANVMRVLAAEVLAKDFIPSNLLSAMIYNGVMLYFTDLMLPDTDDTYKIGYTKDQLKWCHFNEPEIWTFFVDKELLYESNSTNYSRYITEGPSTSGMPVEAPGNIGSWVGWQIVRSFMQNNPDVEITELLTTYSAQQILDRSRYRPQSKVIR